MMQRIHRSVCPRLLHAAVCLAVVGSAAEVHAITNVWVQNNTTRTLRFNTSGPSGKWHKGTTTINPGGRAVVFKAERWGEIKNGKTYLIESSVTAVGEKTLGKPPKLQVRLKGTDMHSDMWQSVKGQFDIQYPWLSDDGTKKNATWSVDGRAINIKYWSFGTGGDSDVEFAFQEEYPLPVGSMKKRGEWYDRHLNVLTWNIFLRGFPLVEYQTGRARMVGQVVKGYDVIAFNEVFDNDGERHLRKALKKAGYPHLTKVLGAGKSITHGTWNGGVMIASKHTIVGTDAAYFGSSCTGEDCKADKGVLYAKIDKSTRKGVHNYFHVFSSHMNQAEDSWKEQKEQLKIIKRLIDKQKIPKGEPIIVLGDMNIDKCRKFAKGPLVVKPASGTEHRCRRFNTHYTKMLSILDVHAIAHRGYKYGQDGRINGFNNWETKALRPIEKSDRGNLDYILIGNSGLQETKASYAETRILRHSDEWRKLPTDRARWEISDHFPIYGNLHFRDASLDNWDPGVVTTPLVRFWNGKDVAESGSGKDEKRLEAAGWKRVGELGVGFTTRKDAIIELRRHKGGAGAYALSSATTKLRFYKRTVKAGGKSYVEHFASTDQKNVGKYTQVGKVVHIFTASGVIERPTLKQSVLPITRYYNSKTRDNLLAVAPGDHTHAKKNGYRKLRVEGYVLPPRNSGLKVTCNANSDCPTGLVCLLSATSNKPAPKNNKFRFSARRKKTARVRTKQPRRPRPRPRVFNRKRAVKVGAPKMGKCGIAPPK